MDNTRTCIFYPIEDIANFNSIFFVCILRFSVFLCRNSAIPLRALVMSAMVGGRIIHRSLREI